MRCNVDKLDIWVDGFALQKHRIYTIATNDFIAGGNMEGYEFKNIPDEHKVSAGEKNMRSMMEEDLKCHPQDNPLRAPAAGRVALLKPGVDDISIYEVIAERLKR